MPGTPSSRACDACRKQKKSCDQARPSCSRCARLGIACIGAGQQRFKFVQDPRTAGETSYSHNANLEDFNASATVSGIPFPPSNEMTLLTGTFCSALDVEDVRYSLGVYGEFVKEIPKRLGTDAALDASARVFMNGIPMIHYQQQSSKALEDYVQALGAMRVSLADSSRGRSINNLCAMYLMFICQDWMGQSKNASASVEAMSYLLSKSDLLDWKDSFANQLLIPLFVIVALESISNPRVQLSPWMEREIEPHDNKNSIEGLRLRTLANISTFIKCPEQHLPEIKASYLQMGQDVQKMKQRVSAISNLPGQAKILHSRFQVALSMLLAFALILNTIACPFEYDNAVLVQESVALVDEVIVLAKGAAQYRPLGSSGIPLSLSVAWAVTRDANQQLELESLLTAYQLDASNTVWFEAASALRGILAPSGQLS